MLTHGFVLDDQGRKMSKSLGNTLAPQVIAEKNGADILRLWAASSDFTEDLRIGQDIIKANVEAYRRLRNTIRFMLANLAGFDEKERIGIDKMPELERFMLARLAELDAQVREGYAAFDFNRVTATLFNFCTNEVVGLLFRHPQGRSLLRRRHAPRRRAARTVMDEIFRRIVTWFAPILCFTMEEAWLSRFPAKTKACICRPSSRCRPHWANPALIEKWKRIRELRRVVTGALELERAAKKIGSSLEAAPTLYVADEGRCGHCSASIPFDEVAITSGIGIVPGGSAAGGAFALARCEGRGRGRRPVAGRQMRPLLAGAARSGQPQGPSRSLQPLRRGGAIAKGPA